MKKEDIENMTDWEFEGLKNPAEDTRELKLEDFMGNDEEPDGFDIVISEEEEKLKQTVEEVKAVRELIEAGNSAKKIAGILGKDVARIRLIHMCLYGATEDGNDIAAAHLVMMEE